METTNKEYGNSLTFMSEADSSNAGAMFQTMSEVAEVVSFRIKFTSQSHTQVRCFSSGLDHRVNMTLIFLRRG